MYEVYNILAEEIVFGAIFVNNVVWLYNGLFVSNRCFIMSPYSFFI